MSMPFFWCYDIKLAAEFSGVVRRVQRAIASSIIAVYLSNLILKSGLTSRD